MSPGGPNEPKRILVQDVSGSRAVQTPRSSEPCTGEEVPVARAPVLMAGGSPVERPVAVSTTRAVDFGAFALFDDHLDGNNDQCESA